MFMVSNFAKICNPIGLCIIKTAMPMDQANVTSLIGLGTSVCVLNLLLVKVAMTACLHVSLFASHTLTPHTYAHTCSHTHTYMHTRIHTCSHTHAHTYTHTCSYTHTHMLTHSHIHAHTLTHTCSHTHTHTHSHTHRNLFTAPFRARASENGSVHVERRHQLPPVHVP